MWYFKACVPCVLSDQGTGRIHHRRHSRFCVLGTLQSFLLPALMTMPPPHPSCVSRLLPLDVFRRFLVSDVLKPVGVGTHTHTHTRAHLDAVAYLAEKQKCGFAVLVV